MGLKLLGYGTLDAGKTGFSVTMSEVGNIGVVDTEQRWQFYTDPHPTVKPRKPSDAAIKAGVPAEVYANPRRIRQDIPWLPKNDNVIWLVQTMDPAKAWECARIWGTDPTIIGQVRDSASVLWDMLQDTRDDSNEKAGALSWAPVKKADRRMTYTMLESGQHAIWIAHKQELMNSKMEVIGSKPWVEKRTPHWFDIVLQFAAREEDKPTKARVEAEKVLGGVNGSLKKGSVILSPTFKQILVLAGGDRTMGAAPAAPLSEVDRNARTLVNQQAASAATTGADSPTGGR